MTQSYDSVKAAILQHNIILSQDLKLTSDQTATKIATRLTDLANKEQLMATHINATRGETCHSSAPLYHPCSVIKALQMVQELKTTHKYVSRVVSMEHPVRQGPIRAWTILTEKDHYTTI